MGAGKSKSKKKDGVVAVQSPSTARPQPNTASSSSAKTSSTNGVSAPKPDPAPVAAAPEPEASSSTAAAPTQKPVSAPAAVPEPVDELFTMDPHEIATDLFSVLCSFQSLVTEFSVSESSFGSPEHVESMSEVQTKFLDAVEPLVNPRKLAQWIRPLHPFQTGLVNSRATSVRGDADNLKGIFTRFGSDARTDPGVKSTLRECFKSTLSNLFYLYGGIEVAFPEYLASQVDNTSTSVQTCMERALQHDISKYEAAYRICITESIKLARISNTKGFQTSNVDVQRELGDSAFTCLRASAILTNLGRGYIAEPSDNVVQNMAAIAKGLVSQYQKIGELSKIDVTQTDSLFTPETIASFHSAYDAACKLLDDSCNQYRASSEPDETILSIYQHLTEEVPTFKEVLTVPNTRAFALSVSKISRLIQLLCIHVSSLLQPDIDAPIYHMILNGMFASLHYCIQLNLAAACKSLYHPVIPPELSALCAIRLMFGTLGVVLVNACPALHNGATNPTEDNYDGLELLTASTSVPNASITDVLHYGRPLIIRDEPKVVMVKTEPETVNSILNALEDEMGLDRGPSTAPPALTPVVVTSTAPVANGHTSKPSGNPLGDTPVLAPASPRREPSKVRPSLTEFSKNINDPTPAVVVPSRPNNTTSSNPLGAAPVVAATPVKTPEVSKPVEPVAAPSKAPDTSSAAGVGPAGAPTPWTTIPADTIDENNLPPGYPPFPPKVQPFEKGGSEDAYKKWMVDRYNREAAENALIVYKRKLKAAQQSVGIN